MTSGIPQPTAPRGAAPLIDLHGHPGHFFLTGLTPGAPGSALAAIGGQGTDLAEAVAARLAVVAVATISDLRGLTLNAGGEIVPTGAVSDDELYADQLRQLAAAHAAIDAAGMTVLAAAGDVDRAVRTGVPCALLACEGADFVGSDLGRLGEAARRGVRSVQLVHYRASSVGDLQTLPPAHDGLSAAGRDIVRELNRLDLLVDLAHASRATTRDAVRVSTRPVMISHTHLNGTRHDHPRMVDPEHAHIVADSGGVIGAWPSGFSSRDFDDFVREIARLVDEVGIDHVGVGTDMDGNYKPVMDRYRQFHDLRAALLARGCSATEADAVVGGNAARLLRDVCG